MESTPSPHIGVFPIARHVVFSNPPAAKGAQEKTTSGVWTGDSLGVSPRRKPRRCGEPSISTNTDRYLESTRISTNGPPCRRMDVQRTPFSRGFPAAPCGILHRLHRLTVDFRNHHSRGQAGQLGRAAGRTSVITTPCSTFTPNCSATAGVRSCTESRASRNATARPRFGTLLGPAGHPVVGRHLGHFTGSVVGFPSRMIASDSVPRLDRLHQTLQLLRTGHRLAAETDDDVPGLQSGLGGRRVGKHFGHKHALVHLDVELLGQRLSDRLDFTPRYARWTLPRVTSCPPTHLARLTGMAKPTPSLPPLLLWMAVLMPTTSPSRFTSGPPLLPGLIAASVWRKSSGRRCRDCVPWR